MNQYRSIIEQKITIDRRCNLSWTDNFPSSIIHKVFELLDHCSLITFAQVFPNYIPIVIELKYWNKLNVKFSQEIITLYRLLRTVNYLGNVLRELKLNLSKYRDFEKQRCFENILSKVKKIEKFSIEFLPGTPVVNLVVKYLGNLRSIELICSEITNNDLRHIADNLLYLKSFTIKTNTNVNDGLNYLISKLAFIESVILKLKILTEK